MKRNRLFIFGAAGVSLLIPAALFAHHGYTAFDKKAEVTLEGTVTDFHYVNPHSIVEFDVKDDKGETLNWKGELTSPLHLNPLGWTATTFEPGNKVVVTGWPGRNGVHSVWVTKITCNGKQLRIWRGEEH